MTENRRRKGFFLKHAKSSAALVSLAVHAVLIVVALSFVAVTVIQKPEVDFEAKQVSRPKMKLRKLQVPVDVKKAMQQPKLRKQIVAKPKLNKTPDIKMPEIVGVKGGLGGSGGGLGGAASFGFSIPEIDVFGINGKGEKVFILLDASDEMMHDEMGGIPAYTIIKNELIKVIGGLPPTTLFNISVFDKKNTYLLFPTMVSANSANVAKVDEWLTPLNAVRPGMGANEYGPRTLGPGGARNVEDLITGDFRDMESWHRSTMLAMKQQADTVFLLTAWWGHQRYTDEEKDKSVWYATSVGKRYLERYKEALRLLDEDNRKRAANGEPPRVLNRNDKRLMVRAYFPDNEVPPEPVYYYHKPDEYIKGMLEIREKYKSNLIQANRGLKKRRAKADCSFSVIRFVPTGGKYSEFKDGRSLENFKKMTGAFRGSYRKIEGLEMIKSSASAQ